MINIIKLLYININYFDYVTNKRAAENYQLIPFKISYTLISVEMVAYLHKATTTFVNYNTLGRLKSVILDLMVLFKKNKKVHFPLGVWNVMIVKWVTGIQPHAKGWGWEGRQVMYVCRVSTKDQNSVFINWKSFWIECRLLKSILKRKKNYFLVR